MNALLSKLKETQGPLSVNDGVIWFDDGESISLNEVEEDYPFTIWEGGVDIGCADTLENARRLGMGLKKSGSMENILSRNLWSVVALTLVRLTLSQRK